MRRAAQARRAYSGKIAHAEIPAHVVAHAAHLLRRDPEHLGEIGSQLGDAAAAPGVERGAPARGVILGSGAASLDGDAGDALYPGVEPHDVRRTRESIGAGGLVADLDIDAEVIWRIVPQVWRLGLYRLGGARHRR
jgi:hypothetical protein